MTARNTPASRAALPPKSAANSLRVETAPRRAFSSATWPTPSRMVRDTGLTLRRGPSGSYGAAPHEANKLPQGCGLGGSFGNPSSTA